MTMAGQRLPDDRPIWVCRENESLTIFYWFGENEQGADRTKKGSCGSVCFNMSVLSFSSIGEGVDKKF